MPVIWTRSTQSYRASSNLRRGWGSDNFADHRWGKAIEAREQFSPLAACWTSELGGLNKFVHTWVYKDLNERARVREESRKPGGQWPPQTGVRPIWQENKLLMPAAFSPVR